MKIVCRLALLMLAPFAAAEPEEQWYVLLNGEDRLGYLHTTTSEAGDRITSAQTMKLVIGRAGAAVEIEVTSTFVETVTGVPLTATSTMNMGGTPMVGEATFTPEAIEYTATQGEGRPSSRSLPLPEGGWLPPAALERYVAGQLEAGAQEISVRTMDIAGGPQEVAMTMRVAGEEDVEVYGRTVPAVVWDAEVSMMPGVAMREYVGLDGKRLKSTVSLMPGMEIVVLLADRELALSPLSPAEMISTTLITPDRPIDRPRTLTRARYAVSTRDGRTPTLPKAATQRVMPVDEDTVMVEVDLGAGGGEGFGDDAAPDAALLEASPMLDYRDPAVAGLLTRWGGDGRDDAALSEHLRRSVQGYIQQKNLSVGFASADEVARTRQGDCTEHAVLLAALLRGAGVPSRCVSGLVYADQFAGREGIFGYHMWTQGWLDPDGEGPLASRWVDLDATLPGDEAFDATHITLGTSDLNMGVVGNDLAAMLPLLGNLEIEVMEVAHGAPPSRPGGGGAAAP